MGYKDPEKKRAWEAAYRAAHPEDPAKRRVRDCAHRDAKREELKAYSRAYYAAHREQGRDYAKARNAAHPEYQRVYRAAHKEQRRAYAAAEMELGGERVNVNTMPPEFREVALLLKQARQVIRNQRTGGTP